MTQSLRLRRLILAPALIALLAAAWGGLLRLGWNWPLLHAPLPTVHGPLLVGGFLGTLICLERAVALNRSWAYAAPILTSAGALLVLSGSTRAGAALIMFGSAMLVAIFVAIIRRQPAVYTVVMGLGALAWLIGNLLWFLGWAVPHLVLWWLAFLVITIVGERLELSRLVRLTRWRYTSFGAALGMFIGGTVLSAWNFDTGMRLGGAGMLALALWLARYDIARRTVRKSGLTSFIALALLAGYAWLGIGGGLALVFGGVMGGMIYDALLHAIFVGFVISMVFGHAPIIFPALLRLPITYDRSFYIPLLLLHTSLLLRVGGDLSGWMAGRQVGGLFNVFAILLFFGNTARVAYTTIRRQRRTYTGSSAAAQSHRTAQHTAR